MIRKHFTEELNYSQTRSAAYFSVGIVNYGFFTIQDFDHSNCLGKRYVLNLQWLTIEKNIYYNVKKPKLKNLYLLNILFAIPFVFVVVGGTLLFLLNLVFEFWEIVLIDRSFITSRRHHVFGWIYLLLSLFGLFSLLYLIIKT